MKLDEIKSGHMKTFNSFDIEISEFTPNKPSSFHEQPSTGITNCSLLKSPEKHSHLSQFTKHLSSMNLEGDTLLEMPFVPSSVNTYQQTKYVRNINISKQHIMIHLHFLSQQIPIQSNPKKKKTINHYQEYFKFIFTNMHLFVSL